MSASTLRPALPFTRMTALLLLVLNLGSCATAWTPAEAPLAQVAADDPPSTIRVGLPDGSEVSVRNPVVVGDTLYAREPDERPLAVAAVEEVRYVDVPKTSTTQSVGAVVGISVVVLGLVMLVASSQGGMGFSR